MDQIIRPVQQAQRRLLVGRFFYLLSWTLLIGLTVALIGLALPKFWYLSWLQSAEGLSQWNYGWLLGGVALALLSAGWLTVQSLEPRLVVAAEVDKRFQLKERLSSALCLRPEDLNTPVGQALLQDAIAKAELLEVADQFQYQPSRVGLLPLIPAVLMCGVTFLPEASQPESTDVNDVEKVDRQQIQLMIEDAKKRKEERQQEAKGLADAESDLRKLEKKFDGLLEEQNLDKKTALVKLNDIKQQIEERKAQLESSKELKDNLNRLKDAAQGPAKKLSEALGKGEMMEAQKAIKELAEKLRDGDLNEIEQKKLAADLENMANELNKMAQQKREEKRRLEEELKKAIDQGDLDKAAALQEKIDQAQRQQKGIENMEKMAEKLKECADCMKDGNSGQSKQGQSDSPREGGQGAQGGKSREEAADALDEIADQIGKMQSDLEDLQDLEDLEKLAQACQNCLGGNCPGEPGWQDWAQGDNPTPAAGRRAIEEDETGGFRSRVRGKLQKGETIVTGTADGDNIAGKSASEARELVQRAMNRESDPLENQRLPRAQREHAQQYFEALRKNE